jgi:hypothetical protein
MQSFEQNRRFANGFANGFANDFANDLAYEFHKKRALENYCSKRALEAEFSGRITSVENG